MINLTEFNRLDSEKRQQQLHQCCASSVWAKKMNAVVPFVTHHEIFEQAETIWFDLSEQDWLEAFSGHPTIGDLSSLQKKYAHTKSLAQKEQAGVEGAEQKVITQLAQLNHDYAERFGFIFIICATDKSAQEMLNVLQKRINNSREEELKLAAIEQHKITCLRLNQL